MEDTDDSPVASNDAAPLEMLAQLAQSRDDLSAMFDDQKLTSIGADVVRDYEMDLGAQSEWREAAEKALKRAGQERSELVNAPPYRKSNINYPILTVAALQFNARSYPAICKPGEMVKIRVIGSDKGRPQMGPDGQPLVTLDGQVMTQQDAAHAIAQAMPPQPAQAPDGPQQPAASPPQPDVAWQIAPGAKQARADRVADYMNVYLQYRMSGWEEDTDLLLNQVPIIGCGFRKLWMEGSDQQAAFVSGLDLIVPVTARSLDESPRITERLNDVFPFQIRQRMNTGWYRRVELPTGTEDEEEPRLLLEAHRLMDLDQDGVDEPYIVTVDHATSQVLRIVSNFDEDDVELDDQGAVTNINRARYYIKYPFLPHPKGWFYDIGFGHLLEQIGDAINTTFNQMFDAGHAQIAGGGFIGAGLRLQGNSRSEQIRFEPGEYKTVNVSGPDLRASIVERTFPQPSKIMFNLLEMLLAAAKDITSVKDILTGDVPNTAPVGTTLAIVEQAQTVFTAIYKRIYRSLGEEFTLIFDNLAKYGDEETAEDYVSVLDDPAADFEKDFADSDMDIKPVADPSSVTRMQQMAKAQFMLAFRGQGLNDLAINRFAMESAGIEDIDRFMPQGPAAPDPLTIAKLRQMTSAADLNEAKAAESGAKAAKTGFELGHQAGESVGGSSSGMASVPGNAMGAGGAGSAGGGSAGSMDGSELGAGVY